MVSAHRDKPQSPTDLRQSHADLILEEISVAPEDIIQGQLASAHQVDKTPHLPLNFRIVQANLPFSTHNNGSRGRCFVKNSRRKRTRRRREGGSQPLQSEGELKTKKNVLNFFVFCLFGRSLANSNFFSESSTFSVSSHKNWRTKYFRRCFWRRALLPPPPLPLPSSPTRFHVFRS